MSSLDPSITAPSLSTTSPPPNATPRTINIGTRKSILALKQTEIVTDLLKKAWPEHHYEVHAISTMGDKNQVTALHDFGAKSLWTHELEAMLLDGEVDMIVHSLKDIPTQIPTGCSLGAILPRSDSRDALVLHPSLPPSTTLSNLAADSIIGTSSVRRSAQLKRLYPHLRFQSVRGNVGTRLRKLDESVLKHGSRETSGTKKGDAHTVSEDDVASESPPYSALILAAAGLTRLDLGHRISRFMSTKDPEDSLASTQSAGKIPTTITHAQQEQLPPRGTQRNTINGIYHAVGQGALGIEIRTADQHTHDLLAPLICKPTTLACLAERSLLRALEGGCSVPIGVETEWNQRVGDQDTPPSLTKDIGTSSAEVLGMAQDIAITAAPELNPRGDRPQTRASLQGDTLTLRAIVVSLDGTRAVTALAEDQIINQSQAEEMGMEVARRLVEKGAEEILKEITLDRKIIEGQGDA